MPIAPTIFRSSDPSAPVLTGAIGSLAGLLDACLVDGYGPKTALGWTTEFTGVNERVYRNAVASGATGFRLRVNDTDASMTYMRGWESAAGLSDLANAFPTLSQSPDATQHVFKSNTVGPTPRSWILIGDAKRFYLGIDVASNSPNAYFWFYFGDFISHRPGDAANAACIGQATSYANDGFGMGYYYGNAWVSVLSTVPTTSCGSIARSYTGLVGATYAGLTRLGGAGMNLGLEYPGRISNEFEFCRVYLSEGGFGVRGEMPGLFASYHGNYFQTTGLSEVPFDNIPGMVGRTFILVNSSFGNLGNSHVLMFETTGDSW